MTVASAFGYSAQDGRSDRDNLRRNYLPFSYGHGTTPVDDRAASAAPGPGAVAGDSERTPSTGARTDASRWTEGGSDDQSIAGASRRNFVPLLMAATIPVLIFAGLMAFSAASQQRAAAQAAAQTAIDIAGSRIGGELADVARVLETLALSAALDRPDLASFYQEARHFRAAQPLWTTVRLTDTSGRHLLDLRHPLGTPLSRTLDRASFDAVISTGHNVMARFMPAAPAEEGNLVLVRVPVMRSGELRYVLTVILEPRALASTLVYPGIPAGWLGTVADASGNSILSVSSPGSRLGPLTNEVLEAAARPSPDGLHRSRTSDGIDVTTVSRLLPQAGNWSVHLSIPSEELDRPVRRSLWALAGGVSVSVALAVGLASIVSFDLSRRRRDEMRRSSAALKAVEQRAALAVEAARLGTWSWDFRSDEITGSWRWRTQLSLQSGEQSLSLARFLELVHADDRAQVEEAFQRCLERKHELEVDFRIAAKGGSRWFRLAGRLIDGEDAILGVLTDIGARKRAEAQRLNLLRRLADAQESIQRRIARELHDRVGQSVTGLSLGLKRFEHALNGLQRGEPPACPAVFAELKEQVGSMRGLVTEVGRDLHRVAVDLRPTSLDDLGLDQALTAYAQEWSRRYGIAADVQAFGLGEARFPADVETTVYRVAIEALTNVAKHAHASHVSLMLERRRGELRCVIEDNGQGFDRAFNDAKPGAVEPDRPRLGLLGMRERLALVRGALRVESSPGRGTTLFIRIPLEPASARE